MNTLQLSCNIENTDPLLALGLLIRLNNIIVFDSDHVQETVTFTYDTEDEEGEHVLEFVMKNKTADHTKIDTDGNIVKDARIIISNLEFDAIDLTQVFISHAVYTHDFNGTKNKTQEKFYGEMGCNGIVSFKFNSPVYLWLLEHM